MESDSLDVARSETPPPKELRALAQLRDRVEAAAAELERLRTENAALAARVSELEEGEGGPTVFAGEDAGALRQKIEGFIEAIDRVLDPSSEENGTQAAQSRKG